MFIYVGFKVKGKTADEIGMAWNAECYVDETHVAGVLSYINCLLLFSLANIAERRVRPYVCVIV